jgi:23S rRNA (cytidine2498-2'-O)-methyltransferase
VTDAAVPAAPPSPQPTGWTGYLAADGYVDELKIELGAIVREHGRLVFAEGPPRPTAWAQNIWYDPVRLPIQSIGEGARALRSIQRNWSLYAVDLHRRASLIEDKLPPIKPKPLVFPASPPAAPLGSWTLLDPHTIMAAPRCSSPFRNGEVVFAENREAPPNRAYLKLWDAFTRLGIHPRPGEKCLDLGASPGGWSWVLHETGATVLAVDKAPLDPSIAALPRLEYRRDSAFALDPNAVDPVDWLCSDVVCYPARLLTLVRRWLESGRARRFICTLKFQGQTDHATAREFAAIPGSQLMHLFHNKHELTWAKL